MTVRETAQKIIERLETQAVATQRARAERAEAELAKLKAAVHPHWTRPVNCAICGSVLMCVNKDCKPMPGMYDPARKTHDQG